MRLPAAAVLLLPLSLSAISALAQQPTHAVPAHTTAATAAPLQNLPIRRVALYKNGVGFFEHAGTVHGSQSVTIDFTTAQLNDVLQTLTAIDLGGGRIQGAGYNSTTPLEQQLKALPLALDADPKATDLYTAVRGARVEVSGNGPEFTGRILNVELRAVGGVQPKGENTDASTPMERPYLTVISDAGVVRTVELTGHTAVRLLDAGVQGGVQRYLQTLAANHQDGLRHLTLTDSGGAPSRELRVSYISEVPVWKCTYRLLFDSANVGNTAPKTATLQGWAVVDNTVGTDWENVQLSLIAGAPQSFVQPISQPTYTRRPEIALPGEAMLTPQTHESGIGVAGGVAGAFGSGIHGIVRDPSGAIIPNAKVIASVPGTGEQLTATADSEGGFAIDPPRAGQYVLRISAPGFNTLSQTITVGPDLTATVAATLNLGSVSQEVTVETASPQLQQLAINGRMLASPSRMARISAGIAAPPPPPSYEAAATASLTPNTSTNRFDDYFEYKLTEPVTIRKNESALVPILQAKIEADPVTLWSPSEPQSLRALWVRNTSGLTLDRGSFSILENGNFSGQGLLDPIHPGERRLLSYAADQAIRVTPDSTHGSTAEPRRVQQITITRGVMTVQTAEAADSTWLVHNAAPEPRTVIVEQPKRPGWTLSTGIPEETTANAYRFRVTVAPGATEPLHVAERHTLHTTYELANIGEDQIVFLLRQDGNPPAVLAALEPVLQTKRRLADLDNQVAQRNQRVSQITNDQNRLRENLKALKGTPEERALAKRYTDELNKQEDELATLRTELKNLEQQQRATSEALDAQLESLNLDVTL